MPRIVAKIRPYFVARDAFWRDDAPVYRYNQSRVDEKHVPNGMEKNDRRTLLWL